MKRLSKIAAILLFASILFACGNSSNENNETQDTSEVAEKKEKIATEETKGDFNKFEDYAAIKTKKELEAKFGKENLKDGTAYYAEGTVVSEITTLTNPSNKHTIIYVWDDKFKTSSLEAHYNIYDEEYNLLGNQRVETNEGLYLGMSLSELKEWNGADFSFSGFGWDYAGGIYGKEDSRITKSPVTVYLQTTGDKIPDFAMGDVELNTSDERLKDVKIIVSSLELYIKRE